MIYSDVHLYYKLYFSIFPYALAPIGIFLCLLIPHCIIVVSFFECEEFKKIVDRQALIQNHFLVTAVGALELVRPSCLSPLMKS